MLVGARGGVKSVRSVAACLLERQKKQAAEEVEARDAELAVQIPGLTDESQGSNTALCLSSSASALTHVLAGVPAVAAVIDWGTILGCSQV